ncbi:MAG: caspase family protein [Pseudomonadota bacterium]|nr:caspase family protein [Pseudomonadota bacterium]
MNRKPIWLGLLALMLAAQPVLAFDLMKSLKGSLSDDSSPPPAAQEDSSGTSAPVTAAAIPKTEPARIVNDRFVWGYGQANKAITWKHERVIYAVAFSPDGSRVLTGSVDKTAVLRDAQIGNALRTWKLGGYVMAVAFSPDGRRVLTGSWDKTAVLWDVQTGDSLHTWQHGDRVVAVAFSPDGRRVLTGSWDKTAVLWDVQTGETLHTWKHEGHVHAVAFSPDGHRVLTGSSDNTAVLRDTQSGETLHTWKHGDAVNAVAFSPDGRRVLTGSDDKTAVVRDVLTGKILRTWRHGDSIRAVAFSPDDRWVLTGSSDNTAVLRDAQSGETLHTWKHGDAVNAVAFSPDGRRALTGSGDNTAVLRDAGEVLLVAKLSGHSFSEAVRIGLAEARQRALPHKFVRQQAELARAKPEAPKLAQDEFETRAQFQARVPEATRAYEADVSRYNQRVAALNRVIAEHYARLGELTMSERTEVLHAAFLAAYGDPVLENMRYDAETGHFFATLKSSREPSFKRTLALAMPLAEARLAKASLERAAQEEGGVSIRLRAMEDNSLVWEGADVVAAGKTHTARFTDADFTLPGAASVMVAARDTTSFAPPPMATLTAGAVTVNMSDDPKLARLQREVLDAQRAKANAEARAAEEVRLKSQLAQLRTANAGAFDDDLPGLIDKLPAVAANPRLHLLVIGIEQYADLPGVPYARRSAELFEKTAQRALGVPERNVHRLFDAEATTGRLKGRINTLLARLKKEDRLIVYFAGHGVPSRDKGAAYLLPQDGGPGNYEEDDLRLDHLYDRFAASGAGHVSVFVDACFSGRADREAMVMPGVAGLMVVPKARLKSPEKLFVFSAGQGDQFANQYKERGHRLFGYWLMRGLAEGKTQLADLAGYVQEHVTEASLRIGPEFRQEPEMMGHARGDLR